MPGSRAERQWPAGRVAVLGIITIAVYGSWFYSFGVLLDPIIADTGWSEGVLTSGFAASSLVAGFGAIAGGWLLDRRGSRIVFSLAAAVALIAFLVASSAQSAATFAVAGAVGGGALGALGFYHVTQTVAVRISPLAATRAIAVLTIWGAFASAIFLPLSAWLVGEVGWRATLRWTTLSAVATLVVGAFVINTKSDAGAGDGRHWAELRDAVRHPEVRRYVVAQGLVGIGVATILVYQVPAMTAAGLSLTAASFWAGARGFAQLGGRVPLMPIVGSLGVGGALRLAFVSISLGSLVLAVAGTPLLAGVFAALAGFGIGASSPLTGMYARKLFGPVTLGTAMGLLSFVFLVVGSIGPAVAGWVATATGSRSIPVIGAAVVTLVAALVIKAPGSVSD
ncbi:MAG: MFS transporter [Actinomycetota bacterium]|nr:MFS transporter [Actinomycetota bacterium]